MVGVKRSAAEEDNLRTINDAQHFLTSYESPVKIKKSRPSKLPVRRKKVPVEISCVGQMLGATPGQTTTPAQGIATATTPAQVKATRTTPGQRATTAKVIAITTSTDIPTPGQRATTAQLKMIKTQTTAPVIATSGPQTTAAPVIGTSGPSVGTSGPGHTSTPKAIGGAPGPAQRATLAGEKNPAMRQTAAGAGVEFEYVYVNVEVGTSAEPVRENDKKEEEESEHESDIDYQPLSEHSSAEESEAE